MRADWQTGGYGRRGRPWHSPKGNLYATRLTPLPAPLCPDGPAAWGFAAALAIREAAIACGADAAALMLKWPNDVLLSGAKLSGLLLELLEADGRRAVSLGIGVNLAHAPTLPDRKAIALSAVTLAPDPLAFLRLLEARLAAWLATHAADGLAPIRAAWLAHAAGLGGPITARLPQCTLHGTFEGLDTHGALRLATPEGPRLVTAGDVFFPGEQA